MAFAAFLFTPVFRVSSRDKRTYEYKLGMLRDGIEEETRVVQKIARKRLAQIEDEFTSLQNLLERKLTSQPVKMEMPKLWAQVGSCDLFPRLAKTYQELESESFKSREVPQSRKKKARVHDDSSKKDETAKNVSRGRRANNTVRWIKKNHGKNIMLQVIKTSAVFTCAVKFQGRLRSDMKNMMKERKKKKKKRKKKKTKKKKKRRKKKRKYKKKKRKLFLDADEKKFLSWIRSVSSEVGTIRHELGEMANLYVLQKYGEPSSNHTVRYSLRVFSLLLIQLTSTDRTNNRNLLTRIDHPLCSISSTLSSLAQHS